MAGYSGYSKSNNAVDAENNGRYSLTQAITVLSEKTKITKTRAKEILKEIGATEWHHSSKMYNRVDYYDVNIAIKFVENLNDIRKIQKSDFEDRVKDVLYAVKTLPSDQRRKAIMGIFEKIGKELNVDTELVRTVYYKTWEDFVN